VTITKYEFSRKYSNNNGLTWSSRANLGYTNTSLKFGRVIMRGTDKFYIWYDHYVREVNYNINGGGRTTAFSQSQPLIGNWCITVDNSNKVHLMLKEQPSGQSVQLNHVIYDGVNWSSKTNVADGTESDLAYDFTLTRRGNTLYLFRANSNRKTIKLRVYSGGWGGYSSVHTTTYNTGRFNSPENLPTSGLRYIAFFEDNFATINLFRQREEVSDTISVEIEEDADDGTETDDTSWDSSVLKVGENPSGSNSYDVALRFNNIFIPQGATINSCKLNLVGNENSSGESVDTIIKGIKEANAGAIDSDNRPSQRNKTTANVAWSIPDRSINVEQSSPDLKTIIQEIVNQSGWASGNSLILVLEDNANTDKDARFVDSGEFIENPWYDVYGTSVLVQYWKDWASSIDAAGVRSIYFVIENLTGELITARLRMRAYAVWQNL